MARILAASITGRIEDQKFIDRFLQRSDGMEGRQQTQEKITTIRSRPRTGLLRIDQIQIWHKDRFREHPMKNKEANETRYDRDNRICNLRTRKDGEETEKSGGTLNECK